MAAAYAACAYRIEPSVTDPNSPRADGVTEVRRRLVVLLPLLGGAVVLLVCWSFLMLSLRDAVGWCFSTYDDDPVVATAKSLTYDLNLSEVPGGFVLAPCIYAAVCFIPFLLLWVCLRIAQRYRTDRFLVTLSCLGTTILGAYFVAGYAFAQLDLAHSGMLCGMLFSLVPIAGVPVGGGAIILSVLVAWLVERTTGHPGDLSRLPDRRGG